MEHILDIPGCSASKSRNLYHDNINVDHNAWCSQHEHAQSVIHQSNRSVPFGLVHICLLCISGIYNCPEFSELLCDEGKDAEMQKKGWGSWSHCQRNSEWLNFIETFKTLLFCAFLSSYVFLLSCLSIKPLSIACLSVAPTSLLVPLSINPLSIKPLSIKSPALLPRSLYLSSFLLSRLSI